MTAGVDDIPQLTEGVETTNQSTPVALILFNLFGLLIGYAITMVLARNLEHSAFETYVGTIATLGLLAAFGEAGIGKYGLKVIPVFRRKEQFDLLTGYLRFSFWCCVATTCVLALIFAMTERGFQKGTAEVVAIHAAYFLPAMIGVGVAVDLVIALGGAAIGTLIARVVVPAGTLGSILIALTSDELTADRAVICFGLGSALGLLLAIGSISRRVRSLLIPNGRFETKEWVSQSASYFAFGFLSSWIFKASLVLTHHLPHDENQLAILAPAFELGCLVLLISKSTDKYFQPGMALLIESRDWEAAQRIRDFRYRFVGSIVLFFLLVMFINGRRLLALYGPDFTAGYVPLCLVSVGSSVWTLFSLAPTFLMFTEQKRLLAFLFLVHGVLLTALTSWLFYQFEHDALSAAAAYCITIVSLSLFAFYFARTYLARQLDRRRSREAKT